MKLNELPMKISSKKSKIEAFRIFSKRANFVFATFFRPQISEKTKFSSTIEDAKKLKKKICAL